MDNISSAFTKLHMPGMASCWRTLNETHQTDRLSFSDGLELLLQSELDSRRNNRIARLIRSANFKQHACIEELEASDARGIPAGVTGNQEYIKIGNEATSKIATIVHQKR